ncbi:MAG: metallophosphoesterase [Chloroflexi bacterium]|nr:metallophosphoesterase [Chloroflexota bacterium]
MKILTVSDEIVETLHSPALAHRAQGVELILACGDLPVNYLEYLVSMLNVPMFYVMGNHGGEGGEGDFPDGGENVDLRCVEYKGLLIAGLEGAQRYNNKPRFQYTENEMRARIAALTPALMLNKARYGRYLDILITHAPPHKIHDGEDYAHRGFKSFVWFIEHYQPRYLIHGHTHVYDKRVETISTRGGTTIVNTVGYKILDVPIIKSVTRK